MIMPLQQERKNWSQVELKKPEKKTPTTFLRLRVGYSPNSCFLLQQQATFLKISAGH